MKKDNQYDHALRFLVKKHNEHGVNINFSILKKSGSVINNKEFDLLIDKLKTDGYVSEMERLVSYAPCFKITSKGKQFIEAGGYYENELVKKRHSQEENEKSSLEKELLKLNIKVNKLNIFKLKKWWMFLLINALLTILVSILTAIALNVI